MIDGLNELKANGAIRQDVDVEVLARAIHCLHVGYILSRHVFAPDRKWDDAGEIVQMAQLLAHGSAPQESGSMGATMTAEQPKSRHSP
jgi:TetR/AcrR family transcriptional regulator